MPDKRRTPQQDLSADLHDFFNRVVGHNKEGIQAVLAVVRTVDALAEKTPDFNEALQKALLVKRLQVDEAKGMEAAKPQADELIARIKGSDTKH